MDTLNKALLIVLQRTNCLASYKSNGLLLADFLKSCAAKSDILLGKSLHSNIIKQGLGTRPLVLKALLNMYAKCNALEECQKVFDETTERDIVMWNILLSGFSASRYHDLKVIGIFNTLNAARYPEPSSVTLAIVLPVCTRSGTQGAGKCVHSYAIKFGMESQTLVGNALLSMYAKSGLVFDAFAVFRGIADKDVVSYNAIIAGMAENKLVENAFELFCEMIKGTLTPNHATIVNALPVCAALDSDVGYRMGKEAHCYVLRRDELDNEIAVTNALLSFYSRIGRTREAQILFGGMKFRDLVAWNSIIAGYASNGQWIEALDTFKEFVYVEMIELDSVTVISILPACAQLRNLCTGKEIHAYVLRRACLHDDISVENALINFYAKCRCTEAAFNAFLLAPQLDVISWNTILDALAVNFLESQFVELLRVMILDGIKPDAVTLLTAVQFWATLSLMKNVKETHGFSLRSGILLGEVEPTLGNALLDAYAKFGNVEYASKMFEILSRKKNAVFWKSMNSGYLIVSHDDASMMFQRMSGMNLTTWNLMLRGYAQNECSTEALTLFRELLHHGSRPDATTVTSILPVCCQVASVHLLKQCHGYALRACFEDVHLNAALVDVYSKCGNISNAYKLYQAAPEKDLVLFTAMIGGFAMHGMGKEGIEVYDYMLECGVKPDHVVITAVLSACRHAGLINEGLAIFYSMYKVHRIEASMEQYACVVDLLGRRGRIKEAFSFLNEMPVEANANIWGTLLGACRTHHDMDVGRAVADNLLKIGTTDIGNYVVLSNLYAADAKWDGVLEMRRLMKMRELKKPAGCSWIEVGRRKNMFISGNCFHPQRSLIYGTLCHLDKQTKEFFDRFPYI